MGAFDPFKASVSFASKVSIRIFTYVHKHIYAWMYTVYVSLYSTSTTHRSHVDIIHTNSTYIHICTSVCAYEYTCICRNTSKHAYTCIYTCICICICFCTCICTYIHIHMKSTQRAFDMCRIIQMCHVCLYQVLEHIQPVQGRLANRLRAATLARARPTSCGALMWTIVPCTYIHTNKNTCIYIYIYMYTYKYIHIHIHIRILVC